jgi:hypothetical protein
MGTTMILRRRDAKAAGLKRYYSGVSCKNGHVCERYTHQNQCVECCAEAYRIWSAANPSKKKAARRRHYERNRDVELPRAKAYQKGLRACGEDYYSRNAETIREKHKKERQTHPAKVRKQDRRIRERHKIRINATKRAWEKRHPDVRKQKRRNRRAKERGAAGRHTQKQVNALYDKQSGKCAFCFRRLNGKYEVDHYVPLAKGGSNYIENIQLLCIKCNREKHATDPLVFAQRNGRLL